MKEWSGHYQGFYNKISFRRTTQLEFTCSKSAIETLKKDVKYVQS